MRAGARAARVLYVHYGPQSGVTEFLPRALEELGARVELFSPVDGFLFKTRVGGRQVPNLRWPVVRAVLAAAREHRQFWKPYYFHSEYAFDFLSARVDDAIARLRPDATIQAGVLFGPSAGQPYYLYLDHTRALAEAYDRVAGLPPPIRFHAGWRDRERRVYHDAAGIFVMSRNVEASLLRDYGVAPERVHVVGAGPNVVPIDVPRVSGHEPAFLFVGKNWEPKGGPELLEAFEAVRRHRPEFQLWAVGAQHPAHAPPGVTFFGALDRDRLRGLFARAAAFVLPTLREAFGLSLLEAMTFGLPCIATRIEAIPEIVEDGTTGILVPPRDPAALARAMTRLASDADLRRSMGAAGRGRVQQLFGWSRTAAAMWAVVAGSASGAEQSAPARRLGGEGERRAEAAGTA